jgi:hypothetical protein
MEPFLFVWVDVTINAIAATALAAVLWQLFHLRRDIMAMLRVLRRIDRKTGETAASALSIQQIRRTQVGSPEPRSKCWRVLARA